ncbi:MAG TPA: type II secretion system protein GspM, partial [Parvularculaceae bacterium]|nr:type II secretion system protein GspM [Parvularculaceae bacterium]
MTPWWAALSARERALIIIAGALFALVMLWVAVVGPAASWRASANERALAAESGYRLVARAAAIAA